MMEPPSLPGLMARLGRAQMTGAPDRAEASSFVEGLATVTHNNGFTMLEQST